MSETVNRALGHWPHVAPLLTAPQSAAEYDRLVRVLDELLDAGAADEGHPLAGLASATADAGMDPPWCSA
jgi:HTH-type transcriptional regulator / antitoxin HigA